MNSKKSRIPKSSVDQDAVIAFSTSLGHLPAFNDELLPEGRFTGIGDFKSALRRVGDAMQDLSRNRGHLVVDRQQASNLILSFALVKDTRTMPLSEDFSVQSLLKLDHKELISGAAEAKKILRELVEKDMDYTGVQQAIESTRNPGVTRRVLPMLGPAGVKIPTTAGILDLSIDRVAPKALHSDVTLAVSGSVVGGLDEITGSFLIQINSITPVEHCVVQLNARYRVAMVYAEHRTPLLLGQLLQSNVRMILKVDSAPLRQTNSHDLRLSLESIELDLDDLDPDAAVQRLAKQLMLDLHSTKDPA